MAKLVSKVYGEALFELAVEKNNLENMTQEVSVIEQILQENPLFIQLMSHPEIDDQEKAQILEKVFKDRISDDMTGFLLTIESKGRFREIIKILSYFIDKAREYQGIGVAKVTTATELSQEQKQKIEKRLLDTTNYQSFCMEYRVDPALIGGVIIRIGDRVVDGSVRNTLNQMAKSI